MVTEDGDDLLIPKDVDCPCTMRGFAERGFGLHGAFSTSRRKEWIGVVDVCPVRGPRCRNTEPWLSDLIGHRDSPLQGERSGGRSIAHQARHPQTV